MPGSGSPTLQTLRTYEARRDALAIIANNTGATTRSSYTYTVNSIGQRTDLTTAFTLGTGLTGNPGDTDWGYDSLGQVQSAAAPGTDADRAYQYDAIGNRLFSEISNAQISNPPQVTTTAYTPDALNQYDAITPYIVVGEDVIAGTPVTPAYDGDGNATSYPLPAFTTANSTLAWDGENRLTFATVNSVDTPTYLYDALSRRIAKVPATGSATLYLYDGWNCIAEYTGTTLTKTYTWGLDLSGSLQGAGGVGGLLTVKQGGNHYYPTYDGNGNVSEYLESDGDTAAHFEYDPFGNLTVDELSNAASFPYRFSTKPQDAETGLYYYGFRYYDPVTGRWPSRDPIEEEGGINLYGFVGNDSLSAYDTYGLFFSDGSRVVRYSETEYKDPDSKKIPRIILERHEKIGDKTWTVVLDGKGGYRPDKPNTFTGGAIAQFAREHEEGHILSIYADIKHSSAIPYKQVFCLSKKGKSTLFYLQHVTGGSTVVVQFNPNSKDPKALLWIDGTWVRYTTNHEHNFEEKLQTRIEITKLQKLNGIDVNGRIRHLEARIAGLGFQRGETQEWKNFKNDHKDAKRTAELNGYVWTWYDDSKVYPEIK